ncbi:hypothetical protein THAOC_26975, partial [Thalassiosira oceanica]
IGQKSPPASRALAVQFLVLELCHALLASLLVQLAVGPLAVHAAVLDEAAGRAVLELDGVAPELAAVGAGISRGDWDAAAHVVDGFLAGSRPAAELVSRGQREAR